jgi:ABC-type multidrug transport system permease subunit
LSNFRYDLFHCDTSDFSELFQFGLNAFWLPFVNAVLGDKWVLEVSVVYSRNGRNLVIEEELALLFLYFLFYFFVR